MKVYGRFPTDVSASAVLTTWRHRSRKHICGIISTARPSWHGLQLSLNGACSAHASGPPAKRVTALLAKLGDWCAPGHRSHPFLLELVKRRLPRVQGKSWDYAQWTRPGRPLLESLGRMPSFWSGSRSTGTSAVWRHPPAVRCDLELIANHVCLMNCPMQNYHQNGFAHASDDTGTLFIDYCFLRCSRCA